MDDKPRSAFYEEFFINKDIIGQANFRERLSVNAPCF